MYAGLNVLNSLIWEGGNIVHVFHNKCYTNESVIPLKNLSMYTILTLMKNDKVVPTSKIFMAVMLMMLKRGVQKCRIRLAGLMFLNQY
jgi:hypothetical protein